MYCEHLRTALNRWCVALLFNLETLERARGFERRNEVLLLHVELLLLYNIAGKLWAQEKRARERGGEKRRERERKSEAAAENYGGIFLYVYSFEQSVASGVEYMGEKDSLSVIQIMHKMTQGGGGSV